MKTSYILKFTIAFVATATVLVFPMPMSAHGATTDPSDSPVEPSDCPSENNACNNPDGCCPFPGGIYTCLNDSGYWVHWFGLKKGSVNPTLRPCKERFLQVNDSTGCHKNTQAGSQGGVINEYSCP